MFAIQQDRPINPAFGSQGAGSGSTSMRLLGNSQQRGNRKCEKDGNFNFLGPEDEALMGDENRNQLRSRAPGLQGREPLMPSSHFGSGALSPLSRLPCWSPLEPLPEIETGEESCGRVPPEGAEGKMEEETGREREEDKGKVVEGEEEEEEEEEEEQGDGEEEEEREGGGEWGESDSELEFSYRSSGSSSSLSTESGDGVGTGGFSCIWDRICVGGSRAEGQSLEGDVTPVSMTNGRAGDGEGEGEREVGRGTERGRKSLGGASLVEDASSDSDTDLCSDLPELQEAVWTLRDRERFKAREMEKHQVQLTMYRRLALIRWVRTLQSRVQEQQNRLQTSFDIILTHRKELLRLGAATASQS
ncbi:UPF0500 protein C1orf216 homolog isoform X2 [Megalops cyprinoides]|nr:UPF0500 protein C1orf216 homolog isoform X2 [Megalops cyprinoides]XP_036371900.1 UPF0500 protein C1orf216 homolog isoform X2 [Megalops cyprinoides]